MDPLSVIFVPGGTIFGTLMFALPLAAIGLRWWRRRGLARVSRACCGNCGRAFDWSRPQYLVAGVEICDGCGVAMRRVARVVLPTIGVMACVFGISSSTAWVVSRLSGGPELAWWLDGRWIPLLTPSVGLVAVTWAIVRLGRRANREADQRSVSTGGSPELLAFPSVVVTAAIRQRQVEQSEPR